MEEQILLLILLKLGYDHLPVLLLHCFLSWFEVLIVGNDITQTIL